MRTNSSVVHSNRTRGNSYKLKRKKFCTNVHKNCFIVRVTEHWNGCPEGLWNLLLWRKSRPSWMLPVLPDLGSLLWWERLGSMFTSGPF